MMTIDDLERLGSVKEEQKKKHRLDNLARMCAEAKDNAMKDMWYGKLHTLAKEYDMMDYFRKIIH